MSGNLFEELKRRKVFKVGAAYLVVAWLAVQGASIGFPAFEAPPWALRVFILIALLGFPVTLVLAWVFDATPEGVQLDPVRKGTKRITMRSSSGPVWARLRLLKPVVRAISPRLDAVPEEYRAREASL